MEKENKYPPIVRMKKDFWKFKKGDILDYNPYENTFCKRSQSEGLSAELYDEAPHLFEVVDISVVEKRLAEGINMTVEEFKKVFIYIQRTFSTGSFPDKEYEAFYNKYLLDNIRYGKQV